MDKNKLQLLLSKLNDLENNKSTSRKINKSDLYSTLINDNQNKIHHKNPKVKSYRMQEEYGEKKFIKP